MSTNTSSSVTVDRRHRRDAASPSNATTEIGLKTSLALLFTIACGFVLIGGMSLDPSDIEARLSLSAYEPFGPFAQVLGGFDTEIAPGSAWLTKLWSWLEGGAPSASAVRWPSCLAALGIALILKNRVGSRFGHRAGIFAFLACCGSIALIDHSSLTGLDYPLGLALIAAIDRILTRGTGWASGLFCAVAMFFGGWPALASILLPLIVIGRREASPSIKLLLPSLLVFAAWSAWALLTVRTEVWAATLTLPFTRSVQISMGLWAVAIALPWAPLALTTAFPSTRSEWTPDGRKLVVEWAKIAFVGLVAGTILPGLTASGTILGFAGLIVVSSVAMDAAWSNHLKGGALALVVVAATLIGAVIGARAVFSGAYIAFGQPYYRAVGIILIGLGTVLAILALDAAWTRSARMAMRVLILVAVIAKVTYTGYFVPETNYRFSKGPWGRAVGQFVPPGSQIYTFLSISPALALATEHPMRQLRAEVMLEGQGEGPKYVLVGESEFDHWPDAAPKIHKIRAFRDEYGGTRVLAKTFQ